MIRYTNEWTDAALEKKVKGIRNIMYQIRSAAYPLRETNDSVLCSVLENMFASKALAGTYQPNRLVVCAVGAVEDLPPSCGCDV